MVDNVDEIPIVGGGGAAKLQRDFCCGAYICVGNKRITTKVVRNRRLAI